MRKSLPHKQEEGKRANRQSTHPTQRDGTEIQRLSFYAGAVTPHSQDEPTELARPIRSANPRSSFDARGGLASSQVLFNLTAFEST